MIGGDRFNGECLLGAFQAFSTNLQGVYQGTVSTDKPNLQF
jgi:hypothetical protein